MLERAYARGYERRRVLGSLSPDAACSETSRRDAVPLLGAAHVETITPSAPSSPDSWCETRLIPRFPPYSTQALRVSAKSLSY